MTFLAANDGGQTNCTVGDTDSLVGMGRSRHHGRLEKAKTQSNWKHQHKAEGTEYFVWKAMFELEPYEADAGPRNFGAVTVLIELQKNVRKETFDSGVELVNALQIPSFVAPHAVLDTRLVWCCCGW